MTEHGHPIEVDLERILPLLAREIYTSPFAFLRENVQNAFDAIRVQMYREKLCGGVMREHRIEITVNGDRLSISDTGIGMTQSDLANFFWSIGRSGKHTVEAKSAGVVGTFGIGGMANFGVCSRLEVI
jgi:molecular chaperone HtpG